MDELGDWESQKFNEVFEEEMRLLERRCSSDPYVSVEELEGILESFYLMADRNCEGRVQDIIFSATIAAYEVFIQRKKSK